MYAHLCCVLFISDLGKEVVGVGGGRVVRLFVMHWCMLYTHAQ